MHKEHILALHFENDLKVEEGTKQIQSANALEDNIHIHKKCIEFLFSRSK